MLSQSKRSLLILAAGLGLIIILRLGHGRLGTFDLSGVTPASVAVFALLCAVTFPALHSELMPRKLFAVSTLTGTLMGVLVAGAMHASKSQLPIYGLAGFAGGAIPGLILLTRKPRGDGPSNPGG